MKLIIASLLLASSLAQAGYGPGSKEKNCDSIVSGKHAGNGCYAEESPLRDPASASPAERKVLNGDGEGKPGPVPDKRFENDNGSSGCDGDDCERDE